MGAPPAGPVGRVAITQVLTTFADVDSGGGMANPVAPIARPNRRSFRLAG